MQAAADLVRDETVISLSSKVFGRSRSRLADTQNYPCVCDVLQRDILHCIRDLDGIVPLVHYIQGNISL